MFIIKHIKSILFISICLLCFLGKQQSAYAQLGNFQNSTSSKVLTKEEREKMKIERKSRRKAPGHSPHKATLYSLFLPGLGQAYNKKYWKIPIVYAGLGGMGYLYVSNRNEYIKYKNALEYDPNDPDAIPNEYINLSESQLKSGRDFYRRNADLSIIIGALWWILNIVDATVDAHLFNFDVSDNLSLKVEQNINHQIFNNTIPELKLSFKIPLSKH